MTPPADNIEAFIDREIAAHGEAISPAAAKALAMGAVLFAQSLHTKSQLQAIEMLATLIRTQSRSEFRPVDAAGDTGIDHLERVKKDAVYRNVEYLTQQIGWDMFVSDLPSYKLVQAEAVILTMPQAQKLFQTMVGDVR